MSVLSRQKYKSTMIVESTEIPLSKDAGNKARGRITTPKLQNSPSLLQVREKKVFAIRRQLAKSTYDLDERLDVALERLLVAVTN